MSDNKQKGESVGFIGLGYMGQGMATNLVTKGYPLTVLAHRNRGPVEAVVAKGAVEVKTAAEVAARSSVIFLCVSNSRVVEGIVRDKGGLKEGLKKGTVVVDCSTSDPNSTVALAAELEALGVDLADSPLGGTPTNAAEGTLSAMVGAKDAIFARVEPLIKTWASHVVHIGGIGDGHRMKLLNNFLAMGYGALYSEALTLAMKVGISPQTFDSVIRSGRMGCGYYQTYMKWILDGDENAHKFTIANAFKDMRYLEAMADAANISNPLGNAVKNSYALAAGTGGLEDYVPMLIDYVARANGLDRPTLKDRRK